MRKSKKTILILVAIALIVTMVVLVVSYLKSEEKYLNDVSKAAGQSFNAVDTRRLLISNLGEELQLESEGVTYEFKLVDIILEEKGHKPTDGSVIEGFAGYRKDGQYVQVSFNPEDKIIDKLAAGELGTRLHERLDEYVYTFEMKTVAGTAIEEESETKIVTYKFIRNVINEFNKPTYYIRLYTSDEFPKYVSPNTKK